MRTNYADGLARRAHSGAPRRWMAIMRDAAGQAPEARVLTLREVLHGAGVGWIEEWFEADEEEGLGEEKVMFECSWIGDRMIYDEGIIVPAFLRERYNRKYGMRVWTDRPTDAQRVAALWEV